MQSFHNNVQIKNDFIARVLAHITKGDLVKGEYWEEGKGSAVGVTVEDFDCVKYESELGLPRNLAYWEDAIFEELSEAEAKKFPLEVLEAIGVGEDVIFAVPNLIRWQFEDKKYGLGNIWAVNQDKALSGFCREVLALYAREGGGEIVSEKEFLELNDRITKAWAIIGERERVRGMERARRFAWIGGRKWAWVSTKPWAATWTWAMAVTRKRNRAQAAAVILAWNGAWKWSRFWQSGTERIQILKTAFLEFLKS